MTESMGISRADRGGEDDLSEAIFQLVRQAQRGDERAVGRLYELYVARIYDFCVHRLTTAEEAEDVTAQVFANMVEHIGTYRETGAPFAAWLFTIARNLVYNRTRDRRRRPTVGLDALVARQSPGADPVEIVERQAAAEMLERAMRRLEEDQRTAFYLNHFTDMTHAEIAALMQKTVSAVKALVRRAKVRLGELLPRDLID